MADISTALSDDKRKLMIEILSESGASLAALINRQVEAITPKIIKPNSGLIV